MTIPILIIAIPIYYINNLVIYNNWKTLILKIIIYTLIYIFISYKFIMNEYERNILNKVISRVKQKIHKVEAIYGKDKE